MTAQELKNSILQYAVQGKLVPQNPTDEPASVLLERIKAEKAQLINEKKIKAEKPLAPITDEEIPFEIPESWVWVRLGDLCDIINGFTPLRTKSEFWSNGTISWFTVADIHLQGRIITKTSQHINEIAIGSESKRILPENSILLCCTASIGEFALTKIPLTTNQQFNGLVIKDSYKLIGFLHERDRKAFELLLGVKGIGMSLPRLVSTINRMPTVAPTNEDKRMISGNICHPCHAPSAAKSLKSP